MRPPGWLLLAAVISAASANVERKSFGLSQEEAELLLVEGALIRSVTTSEIAKLLLKHRYAPTCDWDIYTTISNLHQKLIQRDISLNQLLCDLMFLHRAHTYENWPQFTQSFGCYMCKNSSEVYQIMSTLQLPYSLIAYEQFVQKIMSLNNIGIKQIFDEFSCNRDTIMDLVQQQLITKSIHLSPILLIGLLENVPFKCSLPDSRETLKRVIGILQSDLQELSFYTENYIVEPADSIRNILRTVLQNILLKVNSKWSMHKLHFAKAINILYNEPCKIMPVSNIFEEIFYVIRDDEYPLDIIFAKNILAKSITKDVLQISHYISTFQFTDYVYDRRSLLLALLEYLDSILPNNHAATSYVKSLHIHVKMSLIVAQDKIYVPETHFDIAELLNSFGTKDADISNHIKDIYNLFYQDISLKYCLQNFPFYKYSRPRNLILDILRHIVKFHSTLTFCQRNTITSFIDKLTPSYPKYKYSEVCNTDSSLLNLLITLSTDMTEQTRYPCKPTHIFCSGNNYFPDCAQFSNQSVTVSVNKTVSVTESVPITRRNYIRENETDLASVSSKTTFPIFEPTNEPSVLKTTIHSQKEPKNVTGAKCDTCCCFNSNKVYILDLISLFHALKSDTPFHLYLEVFDEISTYDIEVSYKGKVQTKGKTLKYILQYFYDKMNYAKSAELISYVTLSGFGDIEVDFHQVCKNTSRHIEIDILETNSSDVTELLHSNTVTSTVQTDSSSIEPIKYTSIPTSDNSRRRTESIITTSQYTMHQPKQCEEILVILVQDRNISLDLNSFLDSFGFNSYKSLRKWLEALPYLRIHELENNAKELMQNILREVMQKFANEEMRKEVKEIISYLSTWDSRGSTIESFMCFAVSPEHTTSIPITEKFNRPSSSGRSTMTHMENSSVDEFLNISTLASRSQTEAPITVYDYIGESSSGPDTTIFYKLTTELPASSDRDYTSTSLPVKGISNEHNTDLITSSTTTDNSVELTTEIIKSSSFFPGEKTTEREKSTYLYEEPKTYILHSTKEILTKPSSLHSQEHTSTKILSKTDYITSTIEDLIDISTERTFTSSSPDIITMDNLQDFYKTKYQTMPTETVMSDNTTPNPFQATEISSVAINLTTFDDIIITTTNTPPKVSKTTKFGVSEQSRSRSIIPYTEDITHFPTFPGTEMGSTYPTGSPIFSDRTTIKSPKTTILPEQTTSKSFITSEAAHKTERLLTTPATLTTLEVESHGTHSNKPNVYEVTISDVKQTYSDGNQETINFSTKAYDLENTNSQDLYETKDQTMLAKTLMSENTTPNPFQATEISSVAINLTTFDDVIITTTNTPPKESKTTKLEVSEQSRSRSIIPYTEYITHFPTFAGIEMGSTYPTGSPIFSDRTTVKSPKTTILPEQKTSKSFINSEAAHKTERLLTTPATLTTFEVKSHVTQTNEPNKYELTISDTATMFPDTSFTEHIDSTTHGNPMTTALPTAVSKESSDSGKKSSHVTTEEANLIPTTRVIQSKLSSSTVTDEEFSFTTSIEIPSTQSTYQTTGSPRNKFLTTTSEVSENVTLPYFSYNTQNLTGSTAVLVTTDQTIHDLERTMPPHETTSSILEISTIKQEDTTSYSKESSKHKSTENDVTTLRYSSVTKKETNNFSNIAQTQYATTPLFDTYNNSINVCATEAKGVTMEIIDFPALISLIDNNAPIKSKISLYNFLIRDDILIQLNNLTVSSYKTSGELMEAILVSIWFKPDLPSELTAAAKQLLPYLHLHDGGEEEPTIKLVCVDPESSLILTVTHQPEANSLFYVSEIPCSYMNLTLRASKFYKINITDLFLAVKPTVHEEFIGYLSDFLHNPNITEYLRGLNIEIHKTRYDLLQTILMLLRFSSMRLPQNVKEGVRAISSSISHDGSGQEVPSIEIGCKISSSNSAGDIINAFIPDRDKTPVIEKAINSLLDNMNSNNVMFPNQFPVIYDSDTVTTEKVFTDVLKEIQNHYPSLANLILSILMYIQEKNNTNIQTPGNNTEPEKFQIDYPDLLKVINQNCSSSSVNEVKMLFLKQEFSQLVNTFNPENYTSQGLLLHGLFQYLLKSTEISEKIKFAISNLLPCIDYDDIGALPPTIHKVYVRTKTEVNIVTLDFGNLFKAIPRKSLTREGKLALDDIFRFLSSSSVNIKQLLDGISEQETPQIQLKIVLLKLKRLVKHYQSIFPTLPRSIEIIMNHLNTKMEMKRQQLSVNLDWIEIMKVVPDSKIPEVKNAKRDLYYYFISSNFKEYVTNNYIFNFNQTRTEFLKELLANLRAQVPSIRAAISYTSPFIQTESAGDDLLYNYVIEPSEEKEALEGLKHAKELMYLVLGYIPQRKSLHVWNLLQEIFTNTSNLQLGSTYLGFEVLNEFTPREKLLTILRRMRHDFYSFLNEDTITEIETVFNETQEPLNDDSTNVLPINLQELTKNLTELRLPAAVLDVITEIGKINITSVKLGRKFKDMSPSIKNLSPERQLKVILIILKHQLKQNETQIIKNINTISKYVHPLNLQAEEQYHIIISALSSLIKSNDSIGSSAKLVIYKLANVNNIYDKGLSQLISMILPPNELVARALRRFRDQKSTMDPEFSASINTLFDYWKIDKFDSTEDEIDDQFNPLNEFFLLLTKTDLDLGSSKDILINFLKDRKDIFMDIFRGHRMLFKYPSHQTIQIVLGRLLRKHRTHLNSKVIGAIGDILLKLDGSIEEVNTDTINIPELLDSVVKQNVSFKISEARNIIKDLFSNNNKLEHDVLQSLIIREKYRPQRRLALILRRLQRKYGKLLDKAQTQALETLFQYFELPLDTSVEDQYAGGYSFTDVFEQVFKDTKMSHEISNFLVRIQNMLDGNVNETKHLLKGIHLWKYSLKTQVGLILYRLQLDGKMIASDRSKVNEVFKLLKMNVEDIASVDTDVTEKGEMLLMSLLGNQTLSANVSEAKDIIINHLQKLQNRNIYQGLKFVEDSPQKQRLKALFEHILIVSDSISPKVTQAIEIISDYLQLPINRNLINISILLENIIPITLNTPKNIINAKYFIKQGILKRSTLFNRLFKNVKLDDYMNDLEKVNVILNSIINNQSELSLKMINSADTLKKYLNKILSLKS